MSETVTVTEVGPTNQWGYAEVKFAERGPAKTKNEAIITRATEMVGQAAPAVINVRWREGRSPEGSPEQRWTAERTDWRDE
jgi:hypothetical protein